MASTVKKRIIPKFLLKGGRLVKGVRFDENLREAGNPVTTARVYDSYGVDELIFLDIEATANSQATMVDVIDSVSREVFMPFTAGGGVRSLEDVNTLLRAGSDKVSVNTAAIEDPTFVGQAARAFGDQCITVSIDYRRLPDGKNAVFSHAGQKQTDLDPLSWALRVQEANCGEIMLCSIDRDGTMDGYDLEAVHTVSEALDIPLIASSGAGNLQDCIDALDAGASAIAISSLFLFTDQSPIKVRSFLWSKGQPVRASTSSRS